MNRWKAILTNVFIGVSVLINYSYGQELLTTAYYDISTVNTSDIVTVADPLYQEEVLQPSDFKTDRRFRVDLVYNRNNHSDVDQGLDWRLSVTLKNTITLEIQTLMIRNEAATPGIYSAWADYLVQSDYSEWEITAIVPEKISLGSWVSASMSELPQNDIHLECMVFNKRIAELDESACPNLGLNPTTQELSWTYVQGAVEYDVEWVHIDELDNFTYNASEPEGPFEFKEPVRITTYKHSHFLDLIYPRGTVYFRIRPKGYFFSTVHDHEVYYTGQWCYNVKSGETDIPYVITSHYEGLKNWQYVVAFAENGMANSSITYMDGALRGRQQLARMNSTGHVTAGASLYDHEGRQTVQVIPTPVSGGSLDYYDNLHRDMGGNPFDEDDFDAGTSNPLGTSSGAGKYYSPNNDFSITEEPFRERIPDAQGYVYSQTKFIRDNTGRPRVASGLGYTHRMGGGHESYFYYVKPTERDLRELFGSNVGDVEHYDKQISIDPDGQAHVTYTDQLGRTIAVGLYGEAPENLVELDNNPGGTAVQVQADLMPSNIISVDANGNLQSVTDYYHMNIGANTITLDYDLASGVINNDPLLFGSSCASCYYVLEIHLFDPTGAEVNLNYLSQTDANTYNYVYEKYSESMLNCTSSIFNPSLTAISEVVNISMTGEYRVQKILKVDTDAVNDYIQNSMPGLPTMPDITDITNDYMANIVTTGCGLDCDAFFEQDCREELGYPISGILSAPQQADVDACIGEKCDNIYVEVELDQEDIGDQCTMLLNTLKMDVSPGGWVFDEDLTWQSSSSNWMLTYYPAAGGTFTPTSLQNLEDNWEDDWADVLVLNHPEYCHYEKCVTLDNLNDEEFNYFDITTMADAISQGYINGTTYDFNQNGDPLYSHAMYSASAPSWLNNLNSNYQGTGDNIHYYVVNTLLVNYPALGEDGAGNVLIGTALDNRIWELMRGLFLGERHDFIEDNYSATCNYYDHASANFADPGELETIGTTTPSYMTPMNASCPEVCNLNVELWMQRIQEECPTLTASQINSVSQSLQNYCLTDCDGLFNITGAIQLSDLLSSPMDPDLENVESILSVACGFSLEALAVNDTCAEPVVDTICNVNGYGAQMQLDLAVLTSAHKTGYNTFINSPSIVAIPGYLTMFPLSLWNTSTKLKLTNTNIPSSVSYYIKDIASVSIINQSINGVTGDIVFDIKVVLLDGTVGIHEMNEFSISDDKGGWKVFEVKRIDLNYCVIGEYCEDMPNPFDIPFDIQTWIDDCIDFIEFEANILAQQYYDELLNQLASDIIGSFSSNCFGTGLDEDFTITYTKQEYAFTLYYYDQAGNLVQTVPPQGCHIVPDVNFPGGVWNGTEPLHKMKTMYAYNALGQIMKRQTPDGGTFTFYYNSVQQLRFSQNAEQATTDDYSYTRYDELGRPIEAGVYNVPSFAPYFAAIKDNNSFPQSTPVYPTYEVMRTYYEEQPLSLDPALGWTPENLNNRIAAAAFYESFDGDQDAYNSASYFSYDIHGNVDNLLKDFPLMGDNNRYKTIAYDYDLYSGKMNEVIYQEGQQDQFLHRYSYDDDGRILTVETSRDGVEWDVDAEYYYYLTGQLARTELGDLKVQGIDYAYNINGWLKGMNSNTLEARRDMGMDGAAVNESDKWVAQDAFGFSLSYYQGDYTPIVSQAADNKWFAEDEYSTFMPGTGADLYNGNIRAMVTAVRKDNNATMDILAKVYQYDQLQRIKEASTYKSSGLVANNSWSGGGFTEAYYSSYEFDLNGNLTRLTRNGSGGVYNAPGEYVMDDFTYYYEDGIGGSTTIPDELNRLYSVVDAVSQTTGSISSGEEDYDVDIDDTQSSSSANYTYDAIGRLISDADEEIAEIAWTSTNKVAYIQRATGSIEKDVAFKYDPMGERIAKIVYPKDAGGNIVYDEIITMFYVRDAQGNVMATYEQIGASPANTVLVDHDLYGASRLGVQQLNEVMNTVPNFDYCTDDDHASAIIEINSGLFLSTDIVQYRIGSVVLNDPLLWNGSTLDENVQNLVAAINEKTIDSDVEASVWWSNNTAGVYYIKFEYQQPGNFTGANVDTWLNGVANMNISYRPKRAMGYGDCTGQDIVGLKRFELSNHLGNVLAVITDRKWAIDGGSFDVSTGALISVTPDGAVDYYISEVVSYSDYYPYGMIMPGRSDVSESYRYGFQGQEMDDEIKGKGNSINYKYRMHDPRIGRFFAVDPLASKYPHYSPYGFSGNHVINSVELEGLEDVHVYNVYYDGDGNRISNYSRTYQNEDLGTVDVNRVNFFNSEADMKAGKIAHVTFKNLDGDKLISYSQVSHISSKQYSKLALEDAQKKYNYTNKGKTVTDESGSAFSVLKKATGTIGSYGEANGDLSFINGKILDSDNYDGKTGGEVSFMEANGNATVGGDTYNIGVRGQGKLLTADAYVQGVPGFVSDNWNGISTGFGAHAAVVSGEVDVHGTMFGGIKMDATIGGSALSIGGNLFGAAGYDPKDNAIHINASAGIAVLFGVKADLHLEIDFDDFAFW